jgi:hypothetical protein
MRLMEENGVSTSQTECTRREREAQIINRILASLPILTKDHLALLSRKINSAFEAIN